MMEILCDSCVMATIRIGKGNPSSMATHHKDITSYDEEKDEHKFIRCNKQKAWVIWPAELKKCSTYQRR